MSSSESGSYLTSLIKRSGRDFKVLVGGYDKVGLGTVSENKPPSVQAVKRDISKNIRGMEMNAFFTL